MDDLRLPTVATLHRCGRLQDDAEGAPRKPQRWNAQPVDRGAMLDAELAKAAHAGWVLESRAVDSARCCVVAGDPTICCISACSWRGYRRLQRTSSITTTVNPKMMPSCVALLVTVSVSGLP